MGYFNITAKGVSWIGALRLSIRAATFIKIAILARVLTPQDFGLFGIAALVLAFLEIITETGINVFLLQHKDDLNKYIDTAWVISVVRGAFIALLIFLAAPFVSKFFRTDAALPLIYLVAIIPIVRGFINPANVKFLKELEFKREFLYRLFITGAEFIITVSLALYYKNAQSLILGLLVSAAIEATFSYVFIKPRPKLAFQWEKAKEILHKGKWVTGFGFFNYLYTQGDDIAVGRILGQGSLGIYQNAYKISTMPLTEINDVFYRVTFPVYTKMTDKPERLKKAVKKQAIISSAVLFIMGMFLFMFAEQIVLIVLGPNWTEAIGVVKVLAFLGIIRGITFSFNSLFLALKQQKYITHMTFISMMGMGITIIPLISSYGIVGAAFSEMVGAILALPLAIYYIRRTLKTL